MAAVQRRLIALGYPAGPPNGQFSLETRDALLIFQANNDLAITGVTDRNTRAALQQPDAITRGDPQWAEPDELPPKPATPVVAAVPAPVAPPLAPPVAVTPARGQQTRPAQDVPGRGTAIATLAVVLLGLAATVLVLAALVGWVPLSADGRSIAGDAAVPLMLMGWIMALLAAIQFYRAGP